MKVEIKRVDKTLPLPEYHTDGAVAFDLYSREDLDIAPGEVVRIPTNLIIKVPEGFALILKDRSGTAKKLGLQVLGGVIDTDYHGENDEILFQVLNFKTGSVHINRGDRIGQGIFVKIETAQWQEVDKMKEVDRGGFGSTNKA